MRLPGKGAPWLALSLLPLVAGCASTHYVELYVADVSGSCELTADMGRSSIEEVYVFPEDVIVWVNATGGDIEIVVDPGVLDETTMKLAPGKRVMTPILDVASGDSFPFSVTCSDGGISGPKIVVGDPP
jgi:hypothetical protein